MRTRSASNVTIEQAVIAIGRAQARTPGFELARAQDAAVKLDAVLHDTRTMEATFAVCVTLLRLIGFERVADFSRYQS